MPEVEAKDVVNNLSYYVEKGCAKRYAKLILQLLQPLQRLCQTLRETNFTTLTTFLTTLKKVVDFTLQLIGEIK